MNNGTLGQIYAVFKKDLLSEFRTRYAISAVLLFILTTITMIVFGTAHEKMSTGVAAGILWVIMFFSAMTGLSKSFVSEEERGTGFLLQLSATSIAVFFGKLLFNILLSIALNGTAIFLYFLLLNPVTVKSPEIFAWTAFLGSVGLAGATTIISAIIAKANTKNALFPALSFPILLPLIMIGIEATVVGYEGKGSASMASSFQMMIAYCGIVITASYLLFDFVWKE